MNSVTLIREATPVGALIVLAVVFAAALGCLILTRKKQERSYWRIPATFGAFGAGFLLMLVGASVGSTDWSATEAAVEDAYGVTVMDFAPVVDSETAPVRVREGDGLVEAVIARAGDDLTLYRPANTDGDLIEWSS